MGGGGRGHMMLIMDTSYYRGWQKKLGGRSHDIVVTMDTSCRGEIGWHYLGMKGRTIMVHEGK